MAALPYFLGLCGLCFGWVGLCLGALALALCGAFPAALVNHHDALRAALIDWRVPALALAALPWVGFALPLVGFALALWALLWWGVLACCGACFGLLWGFGFGCGVWLWLQPLWGKGAQRRGRAFFCPHRGLGWGSAVLLCPSGWLVVACVFRFSPCPSGLGRKNTFILVSARL